VVVVIVIVVVVVVVHKLQHFNLISNVADLDPALTGPSCTIKLLIQAGSHIVAGGLSQLF